MSEAKAAEVAPPKMNPIEHGVHRGLRWAVVAGPAMGVNGYVQMPSGHPWAHLGYDAMDAAVHGGLTFHEGRWIGFDTAHAGDVWDAEYDRHEMSDRFGDVPWARRWTLADVIAETHRLVDAVLAGEQS